ncbi:unnamed protein product [Phytophthora fragariaefolia]|uniref:Unnamed protein product n=1 Tax=Phytophthora fragariaefolia TaxID=1490495 RepID=A0A9W7CVK4_9STRA|nr:unnamed protein product [Phytophthora fragariaefolia]
MWGATIQESTENDGQSSAASSPRSIKGSLAFILDDDASNIKRSATAAQLNAIEPANDKYTRPSITGHSICSLLTPTNSSDDNNESRDTITPTAQLARKVFTDWLGGIVSTNC